MTAHHWHELYLASTALSLISVTVLAHALLRCPRKLVDALVGAVVLAAVTTNVVALDHDPAVREHLSATCNCAGLGSDDH